MTILPSQTQNDFGAYVTKDGYSFKMDETKWVISRNQSINWSLFSSIVTDELLESIKLVIVQYAINSSAAHTYSCWARLKHFCQWACDAGERVSVIEANALANYRAAIGKRYEWYVGVIAGLLRRWDELGYHGLGNGLLTMLGGWSLKGNEKGDAIQRQSPTKGALTDLEFEALYSAVVLSYEDGEISLSDFVMFMLITFSGRRPAQIADLKMKDFIEARAVDGLTEYVLNVPRRKVQGGEFRSSFKPFALDIDNGRAVKALISSNMEMLEKMDADNIIGDPLDLPLFPNWDAVDSYIALSTAKRRHLPPDALHLPTRPIAARIGEISEQVSVISERTGSPLKIFPLRLRRTTGTRAAREGYGPLLIAEILDHSDTQNVAVYVENIPEHVNAIDQAVALRLAPIAQAFAGKLVDDETEATRGDDRSSRIRTSSGEGAGTCGHFGFCGALAPLACYTCKSFQPWLYGPHGEVLEGLLADNLNVLRITGDRQMTNIMDRTILAITRVIQLCDERKRSLGQL